MSHIVSLPSARKVRSKQRLGSVSDAAILITAFIVGVVLCWNAAVANAFMSKVAGAAANLLVTFNQVLMFVVIFLVWKLLRWGRERNELLRERNRITAQLNHTIRNACQAIVLYTQADNGADPEIVRASVVRIEQALNEYIPNPFVVVPPRVKTG